MRPIAHQKPGMSSFLVAGSRRISIAYMTLLSYRCCSEGMALPVELRLGEITRGPRCKPALLLLQTVQSSLRLAERRCRRVERALLSFEEDKHMIVTACGVDCMALRFGGKPFRPIGQPPPIPLSSGCLPSPIYKYSISEKRRS